MDSELAELPSEPLYLAQERPPQNLQNFLEKREEYAVSLRKAKT